YETKAAFNPLLASAGRVSAPVSRWCFFEGIDLIDPDRFPISILARLPFLFPSEIWESLDESYLHQNLLESLDVTLADVASGPCSIRDVFRRGLLIGERLKDLNELQARLSENLWAALCTSQAGGSEAEHHATLRASLKKSFEGIDVFV